MHVEAMRNRYASRLILWKRELKRIFVLQHVLSRWSLDFLDEFCDFPGLWALVYSLLGV